MSQALAQVAAAAVVGAFSPIATMAAIAVLSATHRPLLNALCLLAGWTVVLVSLALFMRAVLGGSSQGLSEGTKAVLNLIVGQLLISFGVRNLIGARHPLQHAVAGDQERSQSVPHWMRMLDALTPAKAFGVGALLLLVSPADLAVYLSALQGLEGSDVSDGARVPLNVALILAIDLCILVPLAIYVAMPHRAGRLLAGMRTWLLAHQRVAMAWMLIGFGVLLAASGAAHLMS